jgi:hypothetical protein
MPAVRLELGHVSHLEGIPFRISLISRHGRYPEDREYDEIADRTSSIVCATAAAY